MLNDCVTVHNRKARRYAGIIKVAAELEERDVCFELKAIVLGDFKKVSLYYPCYYALFSDSNMIVEQVTGTDGSENVRFEITTTMRDEVENRNIRYRVGGLTAEEVLDRILKKDAELKKEAKKNG